MRTREEDLLSMLNFSSSSCGALQLINTNKHNFVNFLSVYSKDNAFSNSVSSVTFHPLDYFSPAVNSCEDYIFLIKFKI